MQPKLNKRKCKVCRQIFQKSRPLQFVCSVVCGIAYAHGRDMHLKAVEAKNKRREYKEAKEKQKGRQDYLREAQRHFNAYIRERDKHLGCISCGTTTSNQYAAGHYRTVGSMPQLRFEELNVHKQCNRYCNKELSGNIVNYRVALVKKIGIEKVDWLEGHHEAKHYSLDDIKELSKKYRLLTKQLKEGK